MDRPAYSFLRFLLAVRGTTSRSLPNFVNQERNLTILYCLASTMPSRKEKTHSKIVIYIS
jgi:hypothetical protein